MTLLLAFTAFAQETPVPAPPRDAPVLDLTNTLRPEEMAALKSRLLEFERQKGSQIAVLIVPTTAARVDRAIFHPRRRAVEGRPRRAG